MKGNLQGGDGNPLQGSNLSVAMASTYWYPHTQRAMPPAGMGLRETW